MRNLHNSAHGLGFQGRNGWDLMISFSRVNVVPVRPNAVALAMAAACMCTSVAAQITPDAGQTMRELQRQPALPSVTESPALTIPRQAATAADSAVPINVQNFVIEGNAHIAEGPLQALLADVRGQTLTLGALREAVQRISSYYHAQGYLVARAFLPPQDIRNGVVRIQVMEGMLGKVTLDNQSLIGGPHAARVLAAQNLEGRIIDAARTDRTLLLLSDIPGIATASGDLHPGALVGTSDLHIVLPAEDRVTGQMSADNFGNRYTGAHRLHGSVEVNSPMGWGDRVNVNTTVTDEKLLYGRVGYSVPLGGHGLRAGLVLARSRYELGKDFANLNAHGSADTVSAQLSYPLLRRWERNVWVALNVDRRSSKDDAKGQDEVTRRSAHLAAVDLYGDWSDAWLFGSSAYSNWRVSMVLGDQSIDSEKARERDRQAAGTAGSYSKLALSFGRLQGITRSTSVFANLAGQWAFSNLDSSEQMVLGGSYGVRAYPQGEAVGDQGLLLNLELRYQLSPQWVASAFYDAGRVTYRHHPTDTGKNHRALEGYGLGLGYTMGDVSLHTFVAWRGNDPAVSARDARSRLGLSGSWRF